ncbi:disease resistance protein RGA2-like [Gossypium australe]|uniref:Disease resistance protein RGA2-like n=1 Tax=Gossypium australe TaxID=47621 RepID=A0A5B6WFQ0_9ROSI|nr:disease resistance protein RGA2-like [Gossypium australe]
MCPNITSIPLFPSIETLNQVEAIDPTYNKDEECNVKISTIFLFNFYSFLQIGNSVEELDSLPDEFLQNLTSLWDLRIERCFNLTSMPEGMHRLTSSW